MDPWSRGREVTRGVLRSSPKPEKGLFFAIGEGSRNFVACFLHSSAQMSWYQTPGRRPPPITGRFVNTCDQRVGRSPYRTNPCRCRFPKSRPNLSRGCVIPRDIAPSFPGPFAGWRVSLNLRVGKVGSPNPTRSAKRCLDPTRLDP